MSNGIRFVIVVAVMAVMSFVDVQCSTAEDRPNILVCIGDDIDQRDYGCYGHPHIRTPHIDGLAAAGLLFENAFLTTSSCSPSRISILTGKYPHQTGAEDLHMPLPAEEVFVSRLLQDAGYYAGHMQKTHYGPNGNAQFSWYSRNLGDFPKFLDEAGEKPFFMWVGFTDAHRPYQPGAVDPPHGPDDVVVPPYLVDDAATRADMALYYDEISRMDEWIGKFVAELKRRERYDNTLIVFLGDNGRPFPRAKGTAYDSGIGTPLIMTWPERIPAGKRTTALSSVIDLAPTFLDVAGLAASEQMAGTSWGPWLADGELPGREFIFAERNWHNADEHIRCVRTDRYKLIGNAYLNLPFGHPSDCSGCPSWDSLVALRDGEELSTEMARIFQSPRAEYELYDLKGDPWEFENLAGDPQYGGVRNSLTAVLETWRQETGDFPASQRRRADNVDRVSGVKFTRKIGPLVEEGEPQPLEPQGE